MGSGIAFVDSSIVNVILPILQTDFNASSAEVQWIVEIYTLSLSSLLLISGRLGDLYGRNKIYLWGIALFAVSSILCGLSQSLWMLVASRFLQGIGGAMMIPGSLALLSVHFPPEERGTAIGQWSAYSGVFTALGPVIGGLLTEYLSWRFAFFLNIPFCILTYYLVKNHVPETKSEETSVKIDYAGSFLSILVPASITFAFLEYPRLGFQHPLFYLNCGIGVVGGILFLWVEKKAHEPMLPLDLFFARDFFILNVLTLLLYAGLGGALFFLPFHLIQVLQYSPTQAAASLFPFPIFFFIFSRLTGKFADKYGVKPLLFVGPLLTSLGFLLLSYVNIRSSYLESFLAPIATIAMGMGITVTPLTTAVMLFGSDSKRGVVSGINNAISRTAGLLAIAILGLILFFSFRGQLEKELPNVLKPQQSQQIISQSEKLAAVKIPKSFSQIEKEQVQETIYHSFSHSLQIILRICFFLSFLSSLFALLLTQKSKT